jgi:hypothetical protein
MLDIFCLWAQQTMAKLPAGVQAELTVGTESDNRSARLDLDVPAQIGRVTCWDSGNFHLEILDVRSGHEILEQHGRADTPAAFDRSFAPFLRQLGVVRG